MPETSEMKTGDDRRDFLKKCGTFAAITPPAVTFLLSTTMSSKAIAASGGGGSGGKPGNGFGDDNHEHSGPPGQEGKLGNGPLDKGPSDKGGNGPALKNADKPKK